MIPLSFPHPPNLTLQQGQVVLSILYPSLLFTSTLSKLPPPLSCHTPCSLRTHLSLHSSSQFPGEHQADSAKTRITSSFQPSKVALEQTQTSFVTYKPRHDLDPSQSSDFISYHANVPGLFPPKALAMPIPWPKPSYFQIFRAGSLLFRPQCKVASPARLLLEAVH